MVSRILLLALLFGLFFTTSCDNQSDHQKTIIVSKIYSAHFHEWLASDQPDIKLVNAYGMPSDSLEQFKGSCSGIIISGGPDVNPARYGNPDSLGLCERSDDYRDSLELVLIEFATKNQIPLLGICRGNQLLNVAHGGTLIMDIPTQIADCESHRITNNSLHAIHIDSTSFFASIVGVNFGEVNSSHHQAVEHVAPGFRVVALAEDGVVEAIESNTISDSTFVMGVQYHPEAMDVSNPFSGKLKRYYLELVRSY